MSERAHHIACARRSQFILRAALKASIRSRPSRAIVSHRPAICPVMPAKKAPRTKTTAASSVTVATFIAELMDASGLYAAQVEAGLPDSEIQESMFKSVLGKISRLTTLSDGDKLSITNAINSGPWGSTQKQQLARDVLGASHATAVSGRRPNQTCTSFENMLQEHVWLFLKDHVKHVRISRVSLMATAARSIGIENPSEPTLYRMVAILNYCENNWDMSQEDIHKDMGRLQTFIKAHPRHPNIPYLSVYPHSASDLSDEFKAVSFTDCRVPVDVDIPELDMILGDSRMRGRNASAGSASWISHVPHEYRALLMNHLVQGRRMSRTGSMLQFNGDPSLQPSMPQLENGPIPSLVNTGGDIIPDVFRTGGRSPMTSPPQARLQLAAAAVTAAAAEAEARDMTHHHTPRREPGTDDPACAATRESEGADGSVSDMEAKLLAAGRGQRAAAKAVAVRKRPAGQSVACIKGEVTGVPVADIFKKLNDRWKEDAASFTRHKFVRRAYEVARDRAKAAGFDADQCTKFGATQRDTASALFDKLNKGKGKK